METSKRSVGAELRDIRTRADGYQSRLLGASLSTVTDIPQKALPYTSAALGLASVFS